MVDYIGLLKKEVVPAEGCTEPVAVAFAVSLAAEQLGADATDVRLKLSANIIKNALGVGIPGTGMVGIEIAAALGAVVKQSAKRLEVLQGFSPEQLAAAKELVEAHVVHVEQKATPEALYIEALLTDGTDTSRVIVCRDHTNVVRVEKNGEVLVDKPISIGAGDADGGTGLTVDGIYEFATTVPFEDIKFVLDCVPMNTRVSEEGLRNSYGLEVGRRMSAGSNARGVLLNNLSLRLISATAAASDARMGGCPLSVMTCAGSGNQGLASSLPNHRAGSCPGLLRRGPCSRAGHVVFGGHAHQGVHGAPFSPVRKWHCGRNGLLLRHDLPAGRQPARDKVRNQQHARHAPGNDLRRRQGHVRAEDCRRYQRCHYLLDAGAGRHSAVQP